MSEIGKPDHFDIKKFLEVCDAFISTDDVAFAFHMLDNLPAYYRDNPPDEVTEYRKALYRQLYLTQTYQEENFEISKGLEFDRWECQVRAHLTMGVIKRYNEKNITPHVIELGPANYWLPMGLVDKNMDFTYQSIDLSKKNQLEAIKELPMHYKEDFQNPSTVFVACELIEHLWREEDIRHYYDRNNITAQFIVMSTPYHTFGGGYSNWRDRNLGHLRSYTPNDLTIFVLKHFPEFNWKSNIAHQITMVGERR